MEPPPRADADFGYRIFNADGSEAEQCGNGLRCVAKFVRDRRLTARREIRFATRAGVAAARLEGGGKVTVDMGPPTLDPERIPFVAERAQPSHALDLEGRTVVIAAISMGNPHAVVEVEDVASAPVATLGPAIERHPRFPAGANVGFVAFRSRTAVDLRVHERGAGETRACGTGACAAVVAGVLWGRLDARVEVRLPGGTLEVQWEGPGHSVMMTGPAVTVFQGRIRL